MALIVPRNSPWEWSVKAGAPHEAGKFLRAKIPVPSSGLSGYVTITATFCYSTGQSIETGGEPYRPS
jgi:hypothetical protein